MGLVEQFLRRWDHVRGMTREFVATASDELLDFVPASGFASIREQAAHLVAIQGVYQEVLAGGAVDFDHKSRYMPTTTDSSALLSAFEAIDSDLRALVAAMASSADLWTTDWFGNEVGFWEFASVFIQHEAIHHGQWALHAHLGGFDVPFDWVINWGL